MTNTYSPAARPDQFTALLTSTHGRLTVVEATTPSAVAFLASLGWQTTKIAVEYGTLREIRYAARAAGLSIN